MILDDGKEIQGIFLYSPVARFSKGDFVVEGDCIYICKTGTPVSGMLPSDTPSHFAPYPGELITSLEEYEDYINSPDGKVDKYVSSSVLAGILQNAYFGFGDSGLITTYIRRVGDEIETNINTIVDKIVDDTKMLDLLMRQDDINNAYVRVDRKLPELEYLLNTGTEDCILRQYTYYDSNDLGQGGSDNVYISYRIRLQELVDYECGQVYYRYTKGSCRSDENAWLYNEVISDWKSTNISADLLSKMNAIINYYRRELDTQTNTPSSNNDTGFNYSELTLNFPELGTDFEKSRCVLVTKDHSGSGIVITPVSDFSVDDFVITINVKKPLSGSSVYKSSTLTINTKDCTTDISNTEYYFLDDNFALEVVYRDYDFGGGVVDKVIELKLTDSARAEIMTSSFISIYYRKYE